MTNRFTSSSRDEAKTVARLDRDAPSMRFPLSVSKASARTVASPVGLETGVCLSEAKE